MTARRKRWTPAQVRALGVRTTVPLAGEILGGLCETEAYRLHRAGRFPVPVLQVGRKLIVPTAPILALLGIDGGSDDRSAPADQRGSGTVAHAGPEMSEAGPAPPGPAATITVAETSPKEHDYGQRTALRSC